MNTVIEKTELKRLLQNYFLNKIKEDATKERILDNYLSYLEIEYPIRYKILKLRFHKNLPLSKIAIVCNMTERAISQNISKTIYVLDRKLNVS